MKQRQQLFLSVNRIGLLLYVPLCAALAVYYFFTGSPWYAGFSLGTLLFLFAPRGLHRLVSFRDSQLLRLFYHIFILLAYSGCLVLQLAERLPGFRLAASAFGGFFFCISAAAFLFCRIQKRPKPAYLRLAGAFGVSSALSLGAVWELLHIAVYYLALHRSLTVPEVAFDLLACLLGALLPPLLAVVQERLQIHMYPLYAIEDFLQLNLNRAKPENNTL